MDNLKSSLDIDFNVKMVTTIVFLVSFSTFFDCHPFCLYVSTYSYKNPGSKNPSLKLWTEYKKLRSVYFLKFELSWPG